MQPRPLALIVAAITATVFCARAQAVLLVNGDFEAPAVADGTYQLGPPSGWTGLGLVMNPTAAGTFHAGGNLWPLPASGQQYMDIGNTSQPLQQMFTVPAAGSYLVRWADHTALQINAGNQTSPYKVEVLNAALAPVASWSLDAWHSVNSNAWGLRSEAVNLALGTHTLRFTPMGAVGGTDTLIDAVSISAVPEPATALTLLAGLALLIAARQRRALR